MGDIGSALGEVNTRFGFTGKELEDATEAFIKFGDITGTDATESVKLVSRAIENAGMDAKDYTKLLDILAKPDRPQVFPCRI
jgi:TP901 family phage tail tape measure protein